MTGMEVALYFASVESIHTERGKTACLMTVFASAKRSMVYAR